jgi:hypothetical protein
MCQDMEANLHPRTRNIKYLNHDTVPYSILKIQEPRCLWVRVSTQSIYHTEVQLSKKPWPPPSSRGTRPPLKVKIHSQHTATSSSSISVSFFIMVDKFGCVLPKSPWTNSFMYLYVLWLTENLKCEKVYVGQPRLSLVNTCWFLSCFLSVIEVEICGPTSCTKLAQAKLYCKVEYHW